MCTFLICSCFLVPESPFVWNNVRHCFLLCPHVHLAQGKLADLFMSHVFKKKKKKKPSLCTFGLNTVGCCSCLHWGNVYFLVVNCFVKHFLISIIKLSLNYTHELVLVPLVC